MIAQRTIDRIDHALATLRDFPLSGVSRDLLGDGLRVIFEDEYALYYVVDRGSITVIRVLHTSRDTSALAQRGALSKS